MMPRPAIVTARVTATAGNSTMPRDADVAGGAAWETSTTGASADATTSTAVTGSLSVTGTSTAPECAATSDATSWGASFGTSVTSGGTTSGSTSCTRSACPSTLLRAPRASVEGCRRTPGTKLTGCSAAGA